MNDFGYITIALVLCGLLAYALVSIGIQESAKWEAFKTAHHCKITGEMSGDTNVAPGIGSNGHMVMAVISTADKTGWTCDDGITYWR